MIRGTQKGLGPAAACGDRKDEGECDPCNQSTLSLDGGSHVGEPSPFLSQMGKPRQGRVLTEFTQQVRGKAGTRIQAFFHHILRSPTFWQRCQFT